jgi:hypothetical protein
MSPNPVPFEFDHAWGKTEPSNTDESPWTSIARETWAPTAAASSDVSEKRAIRTSRTEAERTSEVASTAPQVKVSEHDKKNIEWLERSVQIARKTDTRSARSSVLASHVTSVDLIEVSTKPDLKSDRRAALENMRIRVQQKGLEDFNSYQDPAQAEAQLAFAKIATGNDRLIREGEKALIESVSLQPSLMMDDEFQAKILNSYRSMELNRLRDGLPPWNDELKLPFLSTLHSPHVIAIRDRRDQGFAKVNETYASSDVQAVQLFTDAIKSADSIPQETLKNNLLVAFSSRLVVERAMIAKQVRKENVDALLPDLKTVREEQSTAWSDYISPSAFRINAGFAMISTGDKELLQQGKKLIYEGVSRNPELVFDQDFQKQLENAFVSHNKPVPATVGSDKPVAEPVEREKPFTVGYKSISHTAKHQEVSDIEKDKDIVNYSTDAITGPALTAALLYLGYRVIRSQIEKASDRSRVGAEGNDPHDQKETGKPHKEPEQPAINDETIDFTPNKDTATKIDELLGPVIADDNGVLQLTDKERQEYLDAARNQMLLESKRIAKKLGLPENILNENNFQLTRLSKNNTGEFEILPGTISIDYRNVDHIRVLEHEMKHMALAIERTALLKANPAAYREMIKDSCFRDVGKSGYLINRSELQARVILNEAERLEMSNLLEDYWKQNSNAEKPANPSSWLSKKDISPALLERMGGFSNLQKAFSCELKQIEHFMKWTVIDSVLLDNPGNHETRNAVDRKAEEFRGWQSKNGDLTNNPRAIKLMQEIQRSTIGRADAHTYAFSLEEIQARRFENSQKLHKLMHAPVDERVDQTDWVRLKAELKYGVLQEQILEKLAKARGHDEHYEAARAKAKELLKLSNSTADHHRFSVAFLRDNSLLSDADLKDTPFSDLKKSETEAFNFHEKPFQIETAKETAFNTIKNLPKNLQIDQYFELSKRQLKDGSIYVPKKPMKLFAGTDREVNVAAIFARSNGEYKLVLDMPNSKLEMSDDFWLNTFSDALPNQTLKNNREFYVAAFGQYLQDLEQRQLEHNQSIERQKANLERVYSEAFDSLPSGLRIERSQFNLDTAHALERYFDLHSSKWDQSTREQFSKLIRDYRARDQRSIEFVDEQVKKSNARAEKNLGAVEPPARPELNVPISEKPFDVKVSQSDLAWISTKSPEQIFRLVTDIMVNIDESIKRAKATGCEDLARELQSHKEKLESLKTPEEKLTYLKGLGEKAKQDALNTQKSMSKKGSVHGKIGGIASILILYQALKGDPKATAKPPTVAPKVTPAN